MCLPRHFLQGQIQDSFEKAKVQQSFLKYTAQQMKFPPLQVFITCKLVHYVGIFKEFFLKLLVFH